MSKNIERKKAALEELREIALKKAPTPMQTETAINGFSLVRRDHTNAVENCFSKPFASLFIQGTKRATIGSKTYEIHAGQVFVCGVEQPDSSYAVNAKENEPFLSAFFALDGRLLAEMSSNMSAIYPQYEKVGVVSVDDAQADFVEGMLRLARLLDTPEQINVRAPLILKDLHYLLLIAPQGEMLRQLYSGNSNNARIFAAISLMRKHMKKPLRADELAETVGMSVSGLNRHFKLLTGLSPIQYYKQMRLYEAKEIMKSGKLNATGTAYAVGYESISQFTRDYKKMFGNTPLKDSVKGNLRTSR